MSEDRIECSEAELIAAVLDAQSGGAIDLRRGATTAEIARAKGVSVNKAKELIRAEKEAGRLECIKVQRIALDDKRTTVSGWRLVQSS